MGQKRARKTQNGHRQKNIAKMGKRPKKADFKLFIGDDPAVAKPKI